MRKENNTIEITEDVRIPGTDVILEAGDRIEVLDSPLAESKVAVKKFLKIIEDSNIALINVSHPKEDNYIATVRAPKLAIMNDIIRFWKGSQDSGILLGIKSIVSVEGEGRRQENLFVKTKSGVSYEIHLS